MDKPKVVVAGHICLDITPVFPRGNGTANLALSDILRAGTLSRVDGVDIHTGGTVANTGLALALFGADVNLMGKVGKDPFGSMVLDILRERGEGKGMIVSEGDATSYSVVIAVPGFDRIFLHDPGANDNFSFSDIDMNTVRESCLFHFGYPTLMARMFRNGGEELIRMFRAVDDAGVMTSLDLSSVDEQSEAGRADWESILGGVLPSVDFFMPSFEELAFMLDRKTLDRVRSRAGEGDIAHAISVEIDVAPLAERAIALGAKVVLVKCGAKGLYYRTAKHDAMATLERKAKSIRGTNTGESLGGSGVSWTDRAGFEGSYAPERVLSATGAGDTTIAAFLAAALEGHSLERCAKLAAATGASCVEAYDALGGLKTLGELAKKIDAGWRKA